MQKYKKFPFFDAFIKSTPTKKLNLFVNLIEMCMQLKILHSLPLVADLVLTKACNLKCIFCKDYATLGSKQVTIKNIENIARQILPSALKVNICSGGEPYLHPDLEKILMIISRYKTPTFLLSNGMSATEEKLRTIVREELVSYHGFSVDGITRLTVETIRKNSDFKMIINNILCLLRIKKEEGKKKPLVFIRYVLMRSNINELPEAISFWGRIGIDSLYCNYLHVPSWMPPSESLYYHQDLLKQVLQKSRQIASNYKNLNIFLPPLIYEEQSIMHKPDKCKQPWYFAMIDTNGRILPCYHSWGSIYMGNVLNEYKEAFKSIWSNSKYQSLRSTVNNNKYSNKYFPYCSVCPNRVGFGNLTSHLDHEAWLETNKILPSGNNKIIYPRSKKKYVVP